MDAPCEAKGRESDRPMLSSTICSDFDTFGQHDNVSLHQRQWLQLQIHDFRLVASSSGIPSLASVASSPATVNQQFSSRGGALNAMSEKIINQTLVPQGHGPETIALNSCMHFPSAIPNYEGPYIAARSAVQLSMPRPRNYSSGTYALWSRIGGPLHFLWPQGLLPPQYSSVWFPPQQLHNNSEMIQDKATCAGSLQVKSFLRGSFTPGDDCERDAARAQSALVSQGGPPKQDRKRRRSLGDASPASGGHSPRGRLDGESRLVIDFESFGELGAIPQTFGSERWILPNGLRGRHISYGQKWRFETIHNPGSVHGASQLPHLVCVTWRITHLKTNQITERTETEDEARNRFTHGWTIATKVFLDAMAKCAERLRAQAEREEEPLKKGKLAEAAHALEAKGFTQGPLMFGLRHRSVQEFFQSERSSSSSRIAEEAR